MGPIERALRDNQGLWDEVVGRRDKVVPGKLPNWLRDPTLYEAMFGHGVVREVDLRERDGATLLFEGELVVTAARGADGGWASACLSVAEGSDGDGLPLVSLDDRPCELVYVRGGTCTRAHPAGGARRGPS